MNVDYLYSFIVTVEQRSLSKASEKLNISQPALSKQIRNVEEYFGVLLLNRSTTGVELTEAGKLLFGRISGILNELSSIQNEVKQMKEIKSFRIGTLPSLAGNFFPSIILKLEEEGMEAELFVRNTSDEAFELLRRRQVDVYVAEEMKVDRTLWQKKIFDEPYYAVVHHSHRLSNRESICLDEIKDEEFILYPSHCTIRQSISRIIKDIKVKAEVEFGEFLIGYVAAGGGITIVPEISAKHVGHLMVKAIPITDPDFKRCISIISHSKVIGKSLYPYLKR